MIVFLRKITIPLAALTVLVQIFPVQAGRYHNTEFGFAVQYPDRLPTCKSKNWEHEHGIALYLTPVACEAREDHPEIVVEGNYNAAFEASPDAAAQSYCDYDIANDKPPPKQVAAPTGLKINGRRSAVCRLDYDDGRIELTVIAMTRNRTPDAGDTDPDSRAPEIEYDASLSTTSARLEQDLAVFREILKNIQIFKR